MIWGEIGAYEHLIKKILLLRSWMFNERIIIEIIIIPLIGRILI